MNASTLKPALAATAVLLLLVAGPVRADILQFDAAFVPTGTNPIAGGSGSLFYDDLTHDFTYSFTVELLSELPSAAHINHDDPPAGDPDVFTLPAPPIPLTPPGVPFFGTYVGAGNLGAGSGALLLAGELYVNVHTTGNPGGEVRGDLVFEQNLTLIPLPGTLALFAPAFALLALRSARRA